MKSVLLVVVIDPLFIVKDDGGDILKVRLHLQVVAAALVGLAGFDEVGHRFEDSPQPPILSNA